MQAQFQPGAKLHAQGQVRAMLQHIQSRGHLGSVRGLPHVIAMISIPPYRSSILEGSVASIGGIDQTLSQTAADALTAVVTAPDQCIASDTNAASEGSATMACLQMLVYMPLTSTIC